MHALPSAPAVSALGGARLWARTRRRPAAPSRLYPLPPGRRVSSLLGTMVWEAHLTSMKKTACSTHVNLRHMLAEFV